MSFPALRKIVKPPYQALLEALKDGDKDIRLGAINTIQEIALEQKLDVNAIEPLTQALKDENSIVRQLAAEALGAIGDARAVEPLTQALQDTETTVRQMAAYALGYIYDERVIEPLKTALKDHSWWVRGAAKASLKRVRDKLKR